jgi:hypothetical protein
MKTTFRIKNYPWYLSIITILILFACKTKTPAQAIGNDKNHEPTQEKNKEQIRSKSQPTAYPTEPGTCVIQGYIISILPIDPVNSNEPCKSFPCKANVVITKCHSCGFGVAKKPVEGDTLEVHFIHSLAPSETFKSIYPAKINLSGLKQDQPFEAMIKIKLLPSEKLYYEIGNYEVLR